jgi:hypothetical protein
MAAHENNNHKERRLIGLVWSLVFAGALWTGFQLTARWAMEARQQFEMTVPEWIPRLILENAALALNRILS